ncbi:MAG: hypothetical protein ACTHNN_02960 [Xanthobacteraceae bacterium]
MPGSKAGHFSFGGGRIVFETLREQKDVRSASTNSVMAGLVPAIHVCFCGTGGETWMAGINPAMTT